jgi:rRNA small subunit pseudouridine methyltransferase Nep1
LKLHLIIADASLELVPSELWKNPAVSRDAMRRRIEPSRMLLDRSFHHSAMTRLKDGFKRGRPDLVHATVLSATCSPLYDEGLLKVYIHTLAGEVIEFHERTRVPKNYIRFRGLMEKALSERNAGPLIRVFNSDFRGLLEAIRPEFVIGLSTLGRKRDLQELCIESARRSRPCFVVGGFPHGHFSEEVVKGLDDVVRIHEKSLEAHVVVSRLLYEIEKHAQYWNQ